MSPAMKPVDPLSDRSAMAVRRVWEIIHAASVATGVNFMPTKAEQKDMARVHRAIERGQLVVCTRQGETLNWEIRKS